ncbi:hypothetical protein G9A89_003272, partial [Geosiphon pyriformis]
MSQRLHSEVKCGRIPPGCSRGRGKEELRKEAVVKLKAAFPEEFKQALGECEKHLLPDEETLVAATTTTGEEDGKMGRTRSSCRLKKPPPPEPHPCMSMDQQQGREKTVPKSGGGGPVRENHTHVLRSGNTDYLHENLRPALDGVPKQLCMIVKDMPTSIFHALIQNYGDLEAYTRAFVKHANWISLSMNDLVMRQTIQKKLETGGASEQMQNRGQEDIGIWEKSVANCTNAELLLMRDGLVKRKDEEGDMSPGDQELVDAVVKKNSRSKKQKNDDKEDGRKERRAKRVEAAWSSIKDFYDKHEVDAKWLRHNRCCYMMDAWNVLDGITGHTPGDTKVTPDLLRAARMTSADCKWLQPGAKHALLHLQNLVVRSLKIALRTGGCDNWVTTRSSNTKILKREPFKGERIRFSIDDLDPDNYHNYKYYLDSGILRQGLEPVHQALHLDNNQIVNWDITRRIWFREEVTPEEWLQCGYVLDMPLSEEGSWLR